jgi:rhamnose transport system substrate-binding protein
MKKFVLMLLCVFVLAGTVWGAGRTAQSGNGNIQIALITENTTGEKWIKMNSGAQTKAMELGNVTIFWQAPRTVDAAAQLQLIDTVIAMRVNVLMLAPLNDGASVPCIEKARAAGIKVVLVDPDTEDPYQAGFRGVQTGVDLLQENQVPQPAPQGGGGPVNRKANP